MISKKTIMITSMAGHGWAGPGGRPSPAKPLQSAWQGMVGLGREPGRGLPSPFRRAWLGMAGHGWAWQGMAGHGWAAQGMVGHGGARPRPGTHVGTPDFTSPEIVTKKAQNVSSDIYSWGMCVYAISTLHPDPPSAPELQQQVGMPKHFCNTSFLSPYGKWKGEG